MHDVRAIDSVAPARAPLASCRADAKEQRGGIQQFGIACRSKNFPATSAQFIPIITANDPVQMRVGNGSAFITPNWFTGESLFRLLPAPDVMKRQMPACGGRSRLSSIQKICSLASDNLNQWMFKMP
ncbi:hypothetical protein [Burkholderia sp. BCC1988]|uniref:hypothetical protein n=1 Tax=Burkholderia sp. BCC1988 TaxID=2817443 RepID=UPI002AB15709|nr:hypothetical protein [Burkholderia sp. BCC1988]